MSCLNKTIIISFFVVVSILQQAISAPRIPTTLLDNGLIYCTNTRDLSFNPQTSYAGTNMNVVTEQIYNKLFERKNSKIIPSLARSYSYSKDRKTLYITLRKNVSFQKTPWFTPSRDFDSSDVVFSLNRILNPEASMPAFEDIPLQSQINPQYQTYYNVAKNNLFPYFESINFNQKVKSISAVNSHLVKIVLTNPDDSFINHLASQYAVMLSYEYALQLNADNNIVQLDMLPIGTGPYQLKNFMRNQYVRLVRNDHYWKKKGHVKNIIVDLSTSKSGRLQKLLNGECDIVAFPEAAQLGLLKNRTYNYTAKATDGMNLAYLAFNTQRPQMQSKLVRQALSEAIDRKRLINIIYYQTAELANTIIPGISWASQFNLHPFKYDYNPEKARKLLKNRHLKLKMWVVNDAQVYNPDPIKMAEVIKYNMAQVGVSVSIRYISQTYLNHQLTNNNANYDMILTGWLGGSLDPDSFMRPILGCNQNRYNLTNLAHWCNVEFDSVINRALLTPIKPFRAIDYDIAQQIAIENVPIVPIANVKRILLYSTRIKGVETSPFGNINFEKLRIAKKERK